MFGSGSNRYPGAATTVLLDSTLCLSPFTAALWSSSSAWSNRRSGCHGWCSCSPSPVRTPLPMYYVVPPTCDCEWTADCCHHCHHALPFSYSLGKWLGFEGFGVLRAESGRRGVGGFLGLQSEERPPHTCFPFSPFFSSRMVQLLKYNEVGSTCYSHVITFQHKFELI